MNENPLLAPVRTLLTSHDGSYSEYELIAQLVASGALPRNYAASPLSLFQTHFQLMNALYQLQEQWWAEDIYLHISPLEIHCAPFIAEVTVSQALGCSALRDFYLDWQQYESATVESVDSLLRDFWCKYAARGVDENEHSEALHLFGMSEPVDFVSIKQRYRRLVMIHHPDRGGDREMLQQINNAMAVLEKIYCSRER